MKSGLYIYFVSKPVFTAAEAGLVYCILSVLCVPGGKKLTITSTLHLSTINLRNTVFVLLKQLCLLNSSYTYILII